VALSAASALFEQPVLLGTADRERAHALARTLRADGTRIVVAADADTVLQAFRRERPSLVILDEHLPGGGGVATCRLLRGTDPAQDHDVPFVVLARHEDLAAGAAAGVTDWLIEPFSAHYVRTRVRAWLLRTRCRWRPAPLPRDEEQRLAALHRLGLLDTRPEERFDRLTRLAAALFDVPIALVSLVDRDRQWLKSQHGLSISETPREVSFCAHALLDREVMIVPDALLDPRFADSPLVVGEPRVRFYAGYPLVLPGGACAGTLCIVDTRPRQLDAAAIRLLRDLGSLVERELAAGQSPEPAHNPG
jgi:DNA-binding response OmpR family regulator